jgi:microcystin-dependent protein
MGAFLTEGYTFASGELVTPQKLIDLVAEAVIKDLSITAAKLAEAAVTAEKLDVTAANLLAPTGAILAFGGATIPTGWLLCNGASVLRADYPALFTAIGLAWGSGEKDAQDWSYTPFTDRFNLPNLCGAFLRGVSGAHSTLDPNVTVRTATLPGVNTGNNVGSFQLDAFKTHTHTYTGTSIAANSASGSQTRAFASVGATTGSTGGSETRPINNYVEFIIKT